MTEPLTQERLVDAALRLVDREGSEALSMRRLAEKVDRKVASLYNHVAGRGELVELLRARVVARIDVAAFADQPWDRALETWGRSYLTAFAEHPNLIRMLATTPIRDPSTLVMYETVLTALRRGGWSPGGALAAMRTVEAHVLGSALDLVAPEDLLDGESLPAGLTVLRESLRFEHRAESSAAAAFDLGLRTLVRGLAQAPSE